VQLSTLQDKILTFLLEFPPWVYIVEGMNFLERIEYLLDNSYRYAIELRHHSWFNDLAYNYFKNTIFPLSGVKEMFLLLLLL